MMKIDCSAKEGLFRVFVAVERRTPFLCALVWDLQRYRWVKKYRMPIAKRLAFRFLFAEFFW